MFTKRLNAICVGLMLTVLIVGCERQRRQAERSEDALASGPNLAEVTVPANLIAKAVDCTGGFSAWTETKKLELSCVVTIYQPDGSFYLTEHKYDIYPWSKAIRITAQEPLGRFVWEFEGGRFTVAQGNESADVSRMPLPYRDFAELVLKIVTTPVGFCDKTTNLLVMPYPVRIGGLWYRPIELVTRQPPVGGGEKIIEPHWSRVVFFQNQDNSLVEIIWFANVAAQKYVTVRGYDYAAASDAGVLVPHKIEIFKSDPQFGLRERLVQKDLK